MKYLLVILSALFFLAPSFSQTMEWHIKDNYVDVKYMGNNLFKVKTPGGKWGVVNEYGEMSLQAEYDSITSLVENRALLLDVTGQYLKGILNEKGQLVKSFNNNERLANYSSYREGMLAYGVVSGNYYLFGYLDLQGNTSIEPKFFWAAPFHNGKAVIQYKSKNYGLIYKSGSPALNDNRKFRFMSTPVNNRLLIAVGSNKGEKIILANLEPDGKLTNSSELESGTIVKNSSDYRSVSCQNGHIYYFDNAMRLLSSSTGETFNEITENEDIYPSNGSFKKIKEPDGWKIVYGDKTLLHSSFRDLTFWEDKYAIVTSQRQSQGVLKFNGNGKVEVQNVVQPVEFYHNTLVEGNIGVNMEGLYPGTQVQIGILGLKENQQEERFSVPAGYSGIYSQQISYFIPSTQTDSEVSKPLTVRLYLGGMLYKTEELTLRGIHRRGFRISEATAPQYSDPEGNAKINLSVQSLHSFPSSTAKVIVSGTANVSKRFNGEDVVHISIPVKVPDESTKTYSFTITVKEEGCPSYVKTVSKTISHYHLQ